MATPSRSEIMKFISFVLVLHSIRICEQSSYTVPYIANVTLISRDCQTPISTTLTNVSRHECLCFALDNTAYSLLHYHSFNSTCQLYTSFPSNYDLQYATGSRLYFPQSIYPNSSRSCCMRNFSRFFEALQATTPVISSTLATNPRCVHRHRSGNIVFIDTAGYLCVHDKVTLTLVNRTKIVGVIGTIMTSIISNDGTVYITSDTTHAVHVFDGSLTWITNITSVYFNRIRCLAFMNDEHVLVVVSYSGQSIVFFDIHSPGSYSFTQRVQTSFIGPHGIAVVNDSFLEVVSWQLNRVYSFSWNVNSSTWNENHISNTTGIKTACNIGIDGCGRRYVTSSNVGVEIYDDQGGHLATWAPMNSTSNRLFDIIIESNDVIIFSSSDTVLVRVDPHALCCD